MSECGQCGAETGGGDGLQRVGGRVGLLGRRVCVGLCGSVWVCVGLCGAWEELWSCVGCGRSCGSVWGCVGLYAVWEESCGSVWGYVGVCGGCVGVWGVWEELWSCGQGVGSCPSGDAEGQN